MDTYRATGLAEGWIYTEDENEVIEAWQHLHDTGVAYKLQGWFGRTAVGLIEQGIINK
jgi:Leu/Phe-tRNA-protein transferase